MEQVEFLNKSLLIATVRYVLQIGGEKPITISYFDGEFRVDVLVEKGVISSIVGIVNQYDNSRRSIDHSLSEKTTQFLQEQMTSIQMQQLRLQSLADKFKNAG